MSNIPLARKELEDLAQSLDRDRPEMAKELRLIIAKHLVRQSPLRKASTKSQPMTPELAEQIRCYASAKWGHSLTEIANHFNVNIGRVSEALRPR